MLLNASTSGEVSVILQTRWAIPSGAMKLATGFDVRVALTRASISGDSR